MRAISLTQPWASLAAIGAKRIETRSWSTSYRGPLAIHAAKAVPGWAGATPYQPPFWKALVAAGIADPAWGDRGAIWERLPRGAVIAVCHLARCVPTDLLTSDIQTGLGWWTPDEAEFGDFTPGRWAWLLAYVHALPEPIPARGSLGLWNWTPPADFAYPTVRTCRVCGCTDARGCAIGCWWVEADLCSVCRDRAARAAQ